jgi:cytochrome c6
MKRGISILFLLLVSNSLPAYAGTNVHGEELFNGNCAMCHPHGGNVLAPKKTLKGDSFQKQFPKDSMIVAIIRKGIPNTVMSPFLKDRLSDEQVNEIVTYIRTLTPAPPGGTAAGTAAGTGSQAKSQPKTCAPKTGKSTKGAAGKLHKSSQPTVN